MAYGYSIAAPIDSGYIPPSNFLPGRPDMPDASLPVIQAASTDTLGRRNTLAKSLPAMPASEIGDLSFTNYRAVDAAEQMQALAVGQADRKYAERVNKAQTKAEEEAMNTYLEKVSKNANSRQAYKMSETGKRRDRYYVNQIAGGLGALHLIYPIR